MKKGDDADDEESSSGASKAKSRPERGGEPLQRVQPTSASEAVDRARDADLSGVEGRRRRRGPLSDLDAEEDSSRSSSANRAGDAIHRPSKWYQRAVPIWSAILVPVATSVVGVGAGLLAGHLAQSTRPESAPIVDATGPEPARPATPEAPPTAVERSGGNAAPHEDPPPRPAECKPLTRATWDFLRQLPATQLSVEEGHSEFTLGARTTLGRFAAGSGETGSPLVVVLGQLVCRPCMEELATLGMAAREHPAVRITEVLFESDWDGRRPPYAGGNAARIGASGLPFAAVTQEHFGPLLRAIPGLKFPAFVYITPAGTPDRICFGAMSVETPEGKEFNQWINRASVRID